MTRLRNLFTDDLFTQSLHWHLIEFHFQLDEFATLSKPNALFGLENIALKTCQITSSVQKRHDGRGKRGKDGEKI